MYKIFHYQILQAIEEAEIFSTPLISMVADFGMLGFWFYVS